MKKLLLLLLTVTITHGAAAFRIEYGNSVIISEPVFDNLYIAGGTVTINAPIHGDLICAGGTIVINDSVMNDILVAGATVTFNGYAGDDIRCAGGRLYVQKSIGGDLVISGGEVTVNKDVVIGNGLLLSGGNVSFSGLVKNNVKAVAGVLVFNGRAEKDIDLRGEKIEMNGIVRGATIMAAPEMVIGRYASFNNGVRYWSNIRLVDFKSSIINGKAIYDPALAIESSRWYFLGGSTLLALLWYLGMTLLLIAVMQWLLPGLFEKAANTAFDAPLKSLGFGLLFFIVVPVAVIVLFITVIGIPLAVLLLIGYIAVIVLASVISSVVAANWYNNRYCSCWNYWHRVLVGLGVFVLLKLLSSIPFFGWIMMLLIVCISFGAIVLNVKPNRKALTVAAD